MDSQGPFRERDPIPVRVDTLEELTKAQGERLDDQVGQLDRVRARLTSIEYAGVRRAVPWLASPFVVAALVYGLLTLAKGCSDRDAAEKRGTITNCQTQCTAVGLHYGGFSNLKNSEGYYYARCVCGDGHGDGLFVGDDGHLHPLREAASAPHSSLDTRPNFLRPDRERFAR